ncbi:MAG: hypothetical protein Q7T04_01485 [Dehalococcoidia bacterium]|nr:hypothetical protein [Dehalococcoidia bacterium]
MKLLNRLALALIELVGLAIVANALLLPIRITLGYIAEPDYTKAFPPFEDYSALAFIYGFVFALLGLPLAIIGQIKTRIRFLWLLPALVGLTYCLVMLFGLNYRGFKHLLNPASYPYLSFWPGLLGSLFLAIPGVALVLTAVLTRKPAKPKGNDSSKQDCSERPSDDNRYHRSGNW